MDEAISSRLDGLMDLIGVPAERDKFDLALLEWFEAETGLVLPEDFRYALPRIADFDEGLLPVAGKRQWWIVHLGMVMAPVYRHYATKNPMLPNLRDQMLLDWGEREGDDAEGTWFRTRRSWVHEQLWPIAYNNQLYFCFDFRFDAVDPPVVANGWAYGGGDPAMSVFQPVEYIAPSFTALLEQAARWEELEDAPYEPTEHQLAWERTR